MGGSKLYHKLRKIRKTLRIDGEILVFLHIIDIHWTHFPDVLNPEARAWFGGKYQTLTDLGIDGFLSGAICCSASPAALVILKP